MTTQGFKRKLTAILSADVQGYSRLMAEDEESTVRTITLYREVMTTLIQQHRGKVVDSPGDNLLAEFTSVVDAVQCAVAVQKEISARNAELPENRQMHFRIGINLGDVMALISQPGWKAWPSRVVSVSLRQLLITSKVSCLMDMILSVIKQ